MEQFNTFEEMRDNALNLRYNDSDNKSSFSVLEQEVLEKAERLLGDL